MRDQEKLRQTIANATRDGKVPCKTLLEAARTLEVPPAQIARICDEMGVRISNCLLGCFRSPHLR